MEWNLRMGAVSFGTPWAENQRIREPIGDSQLVPLDLAPDAWRNERFMERYAAQPVNGRGDDPAIALAVASEAYAAKHPDQLVKARVWARGIPLT